METLNSMPMVKRFSHLTHPAENEMIDSDKITDKAKAERIKVNRQFDDQYNEFVRGRQPVRQVEKWIESQPIEHRSRLAKRYKTRISVDKAFKDARGAGVLSSITWTNWTNQPPDVRAQLFYKEYIGRDAGDRRQMLVMAQRIPGFWSKDFSRYWGRALREWGGQTH